MSKIAADVRIGRHLRFRELQVFCAVVQHGSMAKAASELGVTQPSVSEIIAGLERTFAVRLFDRSPRGVELTMSGNALFKRSVAVFDELKQSIRDIEYLADPTAGELKLGCPESILMILAPMMEAFCRQYPRAVVHVEQVDNRTLELAELRNRQSDVVLGHFESRLPNDDAVGDLNVETLFDDPVVVSVGVNSRWARRRKIDLAELANESWILGTPGSWPNTVLTEAFRARGLGAPKISLMTISVHLRARMVASGHFITTFPNSVVRLHADRLSLKSVQVDLPARPWPLAIVTLKNRTLSPIVGLFVRHVRNFTRSLGLTPAGR
jgi:DNA-binding transcriptional LysR family regulator